MKKIVAFIVAAAISSAFAAKCNYGNDIAWFERFVGFDSGIEWKDARINEELLPGVVKKSSKVVKNGKFAGMILGEEFSFSPDCKLMSVEMKVYDPSDEGRMVKKETAELRPDGKSVKAICDGNGWTYAEDPVTGKPDVPNMSCRCFDRKNRARPLGKYGCLDDFEIRALNAQIR